MHIAITADPRIPVPPPLYGGIERIVDMLVRGLVDRGHNVTLFAHEDSDVPCRHIAYGGTDPQRALDTLRNTLSVSRLAVQRPDVVHNFGRLAYLGPLLPLDIPTVMSYQRGPPVDRVHTAARLAADGSFVVTGCSDHITDQVRPHVHAATVYNGVPLDTYDFRAEVSEDAPLVFLGRIAEIKGGHTAIEIARRSGRRLIMAGNIPDGTAAQSYFQDRIEPYLDGNQIQYVGPVNDEEKNELLGRAAAFLMPIEWEEPFGIVMAEAMACGTPVIGTRRGAVPEVVDDGVTGIIGDTVEDLVAGVERIEKLSRRATRERCERLFSDRAIVDAYESLYERMGAGTSESTASSAQLSSA
ncbi:glycosyltransferase family 4 protein [Salinibacter ruber]|uniref:glycosyltransferase family 4 protein n=1 Tax=Salinibacter ruber TaxID=146919 RepID=UPI002168F8B0|nr:glycosyltransferase family 4 protein [Salinibacter ruber]MCS4136381.1 glycosyltransferase involved in cell wall biosynthesis [Salinibacter ruber]